MARGKRGGTTHNSPHNGHGAKVSRSRFAIPTTGYVRGSVDKTKTAPWYTKRWGSKPDKRPRPVKAAA